MTFSYTPIGDPTTTPYTDKDIVRLLLNDVEECSAVFSDEEIDLFLTLEGGAVKLAAAQAIDTNADNEALASKVLRTQDLSTDGAKLAAVLHQRAEQLRTQHFAALEGDGAFIITHPYGCGPELTERY